MTCSQPASPSNARLAAYRRREAMVMAQEVLDIKAGLRQGRRAG
jgi:hypothetical protein